MRGSRSASVIAAASAPATETSHRLTAGQAMAISGLIERFVIIWLHGKPNQLAIGNEQCQPQID